MGNQQTTKGKSDPAENGKIATPTAPAVLTTSQPPSVSATTTTTYPLTAPSRDLCLVADARAVTEKAVCRVLDANQRLCSENSQSAIVCSL